MTDISLPLLLFLAVVQGLTEFLPVSSSGHLALIQNAFALNKRIILPVTVYLHIGTLLSLIVYFRNELDRIVRSLLQSEPEGRRLLLLIILSNAITVAVAFPLNALVEKAFATPPIIALFLIVTGLLLIIAEIRKTQRNRSDAAITVGQAVVVGLAQGLAAFAGLSRSGATIATGLLIGIPRHQAGRFSFLISIPAILGANLLEAKDIGAVRTPVSFLAAAGVTAFVVGYLAIHWTLQAVRKAKLHWFSLYCFFIGGLTIFLSMTGFSGFR